MKKDLNWLKKEIDTEMIQLEPNRKERWSDVKYQTLRNVAHKINQLAAPEVLSREWIDHNVVHVRGLGDIFEAETVENLLMPKQEELETKIHELIESYKQEEGAYSNPENGWISGFIEDLKNLVEKEQKYYVDLDTAAYVAKWNGNGQVDIYTDGISGSDEFEFHLTEEEIKNYDERFWPFAEPVEEDE